MTQTIRCPACDQSDLVEKVSTLYLSGLGLNRSARQANLQPLESAPAEAVEQMVGLNASELRQLSRRLKPPYSAKRIPFRALHPDMVVFTFSLILPVFFFGIYTSQRNLFLPALFLLVIFYGIYFWRRKSLVARFERQLKANREANQRVERGISRWMKLYYCARDDIVFQPGTGKYVPTDTMPGLLNQEVPEIKL